eukprot:sb/3471595/
MSLKSSDSSVNRENLSGLKVVKGKKNRRLWLEITQNKSITNGEREIRRCIHLVLEEALVPETLGPGLSDRVSREVRVFPVRGGIASEISLMVIMVLLSLSLFSITACANSNTKLSRSVAKLRFLWLKETSKQPIRTRYLGHVTGYQPIRDHYFFIWSNSNCCQVELQRPTINFVYRVDIRG